jgi:hypothetical protein
MARKDYRRPTLIRREKLDAMTAMAPPSVLIMAE